MTARNEAEYIQKIIKKVGRAVNEYGLIGEGDRCLVAMSGGHDSQVLLETIALRRKHLPVSYELFAVHVDVQSVPYEADREYLETFSRRMDAEFFFRGVDIDTAGKDAGEICFLCSWRRRRVLFDMMKELRCSKLVFGHHLDDIVETLFMNMAYQGSISTMPPKLSMFGGEFDIIRPLCLLTKDEILEYVRIQGFHEQKKECPYSGSTGRSEAGKLIAEFTAKNKDAKQSLFNSMSNIKPEYLPRKINTSRE